MDRKTLLVGILLFLGIGVVAAGVVLFSEPDSFRGTSYTEPYPGAPEIDLFRADGTRFQLREARGKVVLLFFGYTSCPDVCPTTLAEFKQALEQLGDKSDQVQVLFVTVDPERDTPQRTQEYVDHFNPEFVGLSGSATELTKVWEDYGVFRETVQGASAAGYTINHTARVTLIDQDGNLRVTFGFDTPAKDIVHNLKLLLI